MLRPLREVPPRDGYTLIVASTDNTTDDQPAAAIRHHFAQARRIVVKVGSSSLASARAGLDLTRLRHLVDALSERQARGSEIVLVTSGAIAAGLEPLGFNQRPADTAQQQAAAAVGQGLLMAAYTQAFNDHDIRIAQVLLTQRDLARKNSYANALRTFGALTRLRVIPVVNENDTVATREIHLGDNDHLASLVAELVRADALILLSDVDGLYTAHPSDPAARHIDYVAQAADLDVDAAQPGSTIGSGGMRTKIKAAQLATAAGIPVGLARWDQVRQILAGEAVGTVFAASSKRLTRRQGWAAHASSVQGRLYIDAGAARALTTTAASLLAAGIRRLDGVFQAGDSVEVVDPSGEVIARGIVGFGSAELPQMLGRSSADLAAASGAHHVRPVIHRDDLVMNDPH